MLIGLERGRCITGRFLDLTKQPQGVRDKSLALVGNCPAARPREQRALGIFTDKTGPTARLVRKCRRGVKSIGGASRERRELLFGGASEEEA